MSASDKESRERKLVREGITEPRPTGNKNKKARPIIVQFRWRRHSIIGRLFPDKPKKWHKHNAYRSEAEAQDSMAKLALKHPYIEYRIKPEDEQ